MRNALFKSVAHCDFLDTIWVEAWMIWSQPRGFLQKKNVPGRGNIQRGDPELRKTKRQSLEWLQFGIKAERGMRWRLRGWQCLQLQSPVSYGKKFEFISHAIRRLWRALNRVVMWSNICFRKVALAVVWRMDMEGQSGIGRPVRKLVGEYRWGWWWHRQGDENGDEVGWKDLGYTLAVAPAGPADGMRRKRRNQGTSGCQDWEASVLAGNEPSVLHTVSWGC